MTSNREYEELLQAWKGERVVVKVGGEVVAEPVQAQELARMLAVLCGAGIKTVLCHGGGPQISRAMLAFQKIPIFQDGQRVTDAETLDITAMVLLGDVNRKLVSLLRAQGVKAVGLTGIDAGLISAQTKNPALGLVGKIEQVDPALLDLLTSQGLLPVVAPLGGDAAGVNYNINADTVAAEIAKSWRAKRLLLLTNVSGVFRDIRDPASLFNELTIAEIRALREAGSISGGMLPKTDAMINAVAGGVEAVQVFDGRKPGALLRELVSEEREGTFIFAK